MEYLDVLDKNGNQTGIAKERKDVHCDGDWHRHVHIWIISSSGELLLQKRSPGKDTYPNMWSMSCEGHVSAGEDSIAAARKELSEELGLAVAKSEIKFLISLQREKRLDSGYFTRSINDVYVVERDVNIESLTLQAEEVSEVKWVHHTEFQRILALKDPAYRNYGQELSYLFVLLRKRDGKNNRTGQAK